MTLQHAINHTLRYAQKFHTNLSPAEIRQRLISPRFYHLSKEGTQSSNIHPNSIYIQKLQIAQNFARQIKNIFPDILLLAVTGSVATQHPRPIDDIDLLIITCPHTLWLTRLRLLLFLNRQHLSFRRFNQKESANLFCFNLWLDQSRLSLPPSKQNLRNAVDLVLLKPLINRHQTYQKFLLSNSWAKRYVCTPYINLTNKNVIANHSPQRHCEDPATAGDEAIPMRLPRFARNDVSCDDVQDKKFENCKLRNEVKSAFGGKILNSIAFLAQLIYMLPKITTETITLHSAFFHPKRV